MINLTEGLFVGKGCHRKTYINPENPETVIKILYNNSKDAEIQLKRELDHNLCLQKKHKDLQGIAKYFGTIATDMGKGYVFECVRDFDTNDISESLEGYIKRGAFIEDNGELLYKALRKLKDNMLKYGIIPMEMYPYNILCRKNKEGTSFECIIIDDIGTAVLIPIEYWFTFAANNRINRRWKRFLNHVVGLNNHPILLDIIRKL